MKRLKSILIVVAIFVFGMIVGGMGGGTAVHNAMIKDIFREGPNGSRRVLMKYAKHELRLDEDQAHQFWQILNDTGAELRTVAEPIHSQLEATLAKSELRLRAVLKEHQQQQFDYFMGKARANWNAAWLGLPKPEDKPAPEPEKKPE